MTSSELDKFHTPDAIRFGPGGHAGEHAGYPTHDVAVDDLDVVIERMRAHGTQLIGEMQYGNTYRRVVRRLTLVEEVVTTDAHARPSGVASEPLYDVNVPTPTHAERARTLVAELSTGTLCTIAIEPAGYPYGSFVTVAFDGGNPVFLISALAEHTHNLGRDARASLLVAEGGSDDPLANGRVTLLGECHRIATDDPELPHARDVFLAVHPNARYYADFRDFAFWKLQVNAVRYIGGYGRMSWVPPAEWHAAEPDPLGPSAGGIVALMNTDHADALVLYCRAFAKAQAISSATMTSIDRYGFEMSAKTSEGPRPVRLAFKQPVRTPEEARAELIAMLNEARTSTRDRGDRQTHKG